MEIDFHHRQKCNGKTVVTCMPDVQWKVIIQLIIINQHCVNKLIKILLHPMTSLMSIKLVDLLLGGCEYHIS